MNRDRILIIKLSALGDFVMATTAMQAVRAQFPDAHIALLTTKPYVGLAQAMGIFSEVLIDPRPKIWQGAKIRQLRRIFSADYSLVIDLQTNDRTNMYGRIFQSKHSRWSSNYASAAFPHTSPSQKQLHALERHREQLGLANIPPGPFDDLHWAQASLEKFQLPAKYALLVPGGAPHRPEKRWPIASYCEIAKQFVANDITPIVLGHGSEEAALAQTILAAAPQALSYVGQTDFVDIITLGRHAAAAVGNDTGPMHLIGPTGCNAIALFSEHSDPAKCRPRGQGVQALRHSPLAALPWEDVWQKIVSKD